MLKTHLKSARQAGFTLVELAIVMIIIGLLIGGVLKGQELIANAQITSTVAQVKGIDAATTTFRDMFDSMPGDLQTPNTRLPGCNAAPCNLAGNGNRRVDNAGAAINFSAVPNNNEQRAFWAHLNRADLLTGVDPTLGQVWGGEFPGAEIGGGFHVGYWTGNAVLNNQVAGVAANVRAGHYLALHNAPAAAVGNAGFLTPNQAFRIDSKLDDGVPSNGSVLAAGAAAGANGCALNANNYNEANAGSLCNLYIRFQN